MGPLKFCDCVARTVRLLFNMKCSVNDVLKLAETVLLNASWSHIRQAHRNTLQITSRNFATNNFAVQTRLKNPKRVFQSLTAFTGDAYSVTSTRRKDGLIKRCWWTWIHRFRDACMKLETADTVVIIEFASNFYYQGTTLRQLHFNTFSTLLTLYFFSMRQTSGLRK